MNERLRQQVKNILRNILHHLQQWEQAGYFSSRLWIVMLVIGFMAVFWLARKNILILTEAQEIRSEIQTTGTPLSSLTDARPILSVQEQILKSAPNLITPTPGMVISALLTATVTATPNISPTPSPTPLFTFHTIQENETLITIAALYEVTSEALLAANDIIDPTQLEIGRQLLIPPAEGLRMPVVLHEIKTGDSLLSIAATYGSSVKELLKANPTLSKDDPLPAGDTVAVPIIFNQPKPQRTDSSETRYYTVQPGDIPLMIAAQFDIPVEILLTANGITDPTNLRVGKRLTIPPHAGITLGFPVILHELKEQDTLVGLATQYGSSVKDILAINPKLLPSTLEEGLLVAIPIIFPQPKPETFVEQPTAFTPQVEPSDPLLDLQQEMIEAVNAERKAAGLSLYQLDTELTQIAESHAQDMVRYNYFSHINLEGLTLRRRMRTGGIYALNAGENIQKNTQPKEKTVQTATDWFMSSTPHRNNLLHPAYNRIGVGIVEGPPGMYTFVLDFAKR